MSEKQEIVNIDRMNRVGYDYIEWSKGRSFDRWSEDGHIVKPPWYQILYACGLVGISIENAPNFDLKDSKDYRSKLGFIILNSYLWWNGSVDDNLSLTEFLTGMDSECRVKVTNLVHETWTGPVLISLAKAVVEKNIIGIRHVVAYLLMDALNDDNILAYDCCSLAFNSLPINTEGLFAIVNPEIKSEFN